jgi:hypothetical protein
MESTAQGASASKKLIWAGWIACAVPVLMLLFSASMKIAKPPAVVQGFEHLGYPERLALPLAITELACAILYAIPRTSVLGAILLTGYLGGATATHVRLGESDFLIPVGLGVLAWLGLFLRDRRLRALLPLRAPPQ